MAWPKRVRATCRICGPTTPAVAHGLCTVHYGRKKKGWPDWDSRPIRRKDGSAWKNANGYLVIYRPDHPNATSSGNVMEHVAVMSEILGRPLLDHERVHHLNGQRDDNRRKNLELWSVSQPPGQRVADKVRWAREILALYEKVCD